MHEEDDVLLGTGGDNSNGDYGEFFEGAVTSGFPSDTTENSVQSSITSVDYSMPRDEIVGSQSGRCIDVTGWGVTEGTQLQIWDCSGDANQRWTPTSGKQITIYDASKCLDASGQGTSPGTPVIIWDCNGQANQQWNINSNGTITGAQSGLCLDAMGASTADGTKLELWTCNGGSNQQWSLQS
jgi:non-reducing end alpha-L-arabinofuranosidase